MRSLRDLLSLDDSVLVQIERDNARSPPSSTRTILRTRSDHVLRHSYHGQPSTTTRGNLRRRRNSTTELSREERRTISGPALSRWGESTNVRLEDAQAHDRGRNFQSRLGGGRLPLTPASMATAALEEQSRLASLALSSAPPVKPGRGGSPSTTSDDADSSSSAETTSSTVNLRDMLPASNDLKQATIDSTLRSVSSEHDDETPLPPDNKDRPVRRPRRQHSGELLEQICQELDITDDQEDSSV